MATKKKVTKTSKVTKSSSDLYSKAPLSQRPYVTLGLLALLTCALALTVELIQNAQLSEARARAAAAQVTQVQQSK